MGRNLAILVGLLIAVFGLVAGLSYAFGGGGTGGTTTTTTPIVEAPPTAEQAAQAQAEHAAMLDREWPLHGLVTGTQLQIRAEADGDSLVLGWLRVGSHVRFQRDPVRAGGCRTGWYRLYPRGYACAGQGIEVSETPPDEARLIGPDLTSHLPYRYLFVKEPQVPEWFQLPSREDQRNAEVHAARYVALLNEGNERLAARVRQGNVVGEPPPPREVSRYLDHGFFVASNGTEVRSRRRFVRTVRGTYIKESQLEERHGAEFQGVELNEQVTLPRAWAIRAARPLVRQQVGDASRVTEDEALDAFERLAPVPWLRRERIGDQVYHVVTAQNGEERLLREWYLAVAERIDRPRSVDEDEPWVHVDLSSQTLVMYRGDVPFYATIIASGVEGHDTPIGEFTIRQKMISATMADPGSDLGNDRYRIEDVPWTQYFDGSIALHAAFWHTQFGIVHSHGCVNIAPRDAWYVFRHTWPEVPEGWHGVSAEPGTRQHTSHVIVTE